MSDWGARVQTATSPPDPCCLWRGRWRVTLVEVPEAPPPRPLTLRRLRAPGLGHSPRNILLPAPRSSPEPGWDAGKGQTQSPPKRDSAAADPRPVFLRKIKSLPRAWCRLDATLPHQGPARVCSGCILKLEPTRLLMVGRVERETSPGGWPAWWEQGSPSRDGEGTVPDFSVKGHAS